MPLLILVAVVSVANLKGGICCRISVHNVVAPELRVDDTELEVTQRHAKVLKQAFIFA